MIHLCVGVEIGFGLVRELFLPITYVFCTKLISCEFDVYFFYSVLSQNLMTFEQAICVVDP
jgi:hypothetical protein